MISEDEIDFQTGKYTTLASDPKYQRRFSYQIKGLQDPVRAYIRKIYEIAERFFPNHVKRWCDHEQADPSDSLLGMVRSLGQKSSTG